MKNINPSADSTVGPLEESSDESEEGAAMPARRVNWPGRGAVQIPAALVALMGLLNVWSAVTPGLPERLRVLWNTLPFDARRGSHLATALMGFALLLLAHGLARRKANSWALALGALLLSAIAHLLKGLDYEEAIVALVLAVWLWLARRQFFARSDRPSVQRGLTVLAAALAFTLLYGTAGFYLLDKEFRVRFDAAAALRQTVAMFTSLSDPGLEPIRGFGRDFADSIYIIAAVTFAYALFSLLQPVAARRADRDEERRRARAIVEAHGDNAFAFCALLDDKTYWFSPGGSVVAFAAVGRVAVAMGDPIGPRADRAHAILQWVQFCRGNDWRPAFYEIYQEHLETHHAAGLRVLRIAHEAFVDVQTFTLAGGDHKGLRSTINGAKNRGLSAQFHATPLSDALLGSLRDVSDAWLASMHGGEKTFSLGAFEDNYIRNCAVMAVYEGERLVAFANIVSCYHSTESTIDLMRRVADSPKGTMELLFVSLFEWAKAQGFQSFNLGPSPFAGVGEHSDDPATEKAIHFVYEHMDQFYNFKGLHAFKEKFHPQWRPLYLSYDGAAGLPLVAAAVVRADSGQSSWWQFLRYLRGEVV
jgi:phosphatidylglycerol lysyltransferase